MFKKYILLLLTLFVANTSFASTLKFVQLSDVHTQDKSVTYSSRNFEKAEINLENAVKYINSDNSIQYVFFTGDSVDRSYLSLYERFFKIANNLNKPYYMALGNHDVNSIGGLTKNEAIKTIEKYSYAHQSTNNYVAKLNDDFIAIMLDGTNDTEISAQGYFTDETLNWLDKVLCENKDKKVLVFQHFPIATPEKESKYSHKHNIINKKQLLKVLKRYNNVVLVSSGHYHVKGEFNKYGMKHFSTPALFFTSSYFRITTIDYDKKKVKSIKTELKLNE